MAKIAHRASILQSFHTGVSETDRQAAIAANNAAIEAAESNTTAPIVTVAPDVTGKRKMLAGQRVGNGIVRTISDKQVKLILNLLSQKDLNGLNILPGQTIDPTEIKNMGVKSGTALIDKLFAQPNKARAHSTKVTDQGSDKQRSFLTSLMADTNLAESDINSNYSTISEAISALIEIKRSMPKKAVMLTEGMYKKDGELYKVATTRTSGQLVGYKWNLFATPEPTKRGLKYGEFEYLGKAILNKLSPNDKLSIEEAKAIGVEFHYCCVCGIELTNQDSIDAGIGPICASKF